LFQFLWLLLYISCQDGKQVLVVGVDLFKLGSQRVANLIDLLKDDLAVLLLAVIFDLGHELFVLALEYVLFQLWVHEVELFAAWLIAERVHEQVQIVYFAHCADKLADVCQEELRINVID